MTALLINLLTGAVGGNLAGALFKKLSLGLLGNSLAGVVGGGVGGQIVNSLLGANVANGGFDIGSILGSLVGGGGVMAIVGAIRGMMSK